MVAVVGICAALAWFGLRAGDRRVATTLERPLAFVLDPRRYLPLLVAGVVAVLVTVWR